MLWIFFRYSATMLNGPATRLRGSQPVQQRSLPFLFHTSSPCQGTAKGLGFGLCGYYHLDEWVVAVVVVVVVVDKDLVTCSLL